MTSEAANALISMASEIAATTGAAENTEDSAKPPEDLKLRQRLEELRQERGQDPVRNSLINASKILGRLKEDPLNTKLRVMRRDVLERTCGEELFFAFEVAGCEVRAPEEGTVAAYAWPGGDEATEALR